MPSCGRNAVAAAGSCPSGRCLSTVQLVLLVGRQVSDGAEQDAVILA